MKKTFVMAVSVNDREHCAAQLQELFTSNGAMINLRCGSHDSGSEQSLIILKLKGAREKITLMNDQLNKLDGITSKYMEL